MEAQQKMRTLPLNPLDIFAENDMSRRADVDGSALWTADEIFDISITMYDYLVPTLVPQQWPAPRRITQATYEAEFFRRYPLAAKVLRRVNVDSTSVIVAGGAAASPYYENNITANDIDFFIVGIDSADEKALWIKARQIIHTLYELSRSDEVLRLFPSYKPARLEQHIIPGLITLKLQLYARDMSDIVYEVPYPDLTIKYQIIMRAYDSVPAVIYAFDIGSCCISYDGKTTLATTLGVYSQLFRVNLVNPKYRSASFEYRLAKYHKRHYALAFVNLKTGALVANQPLKLPHLVIHPVNVGGNRVAGTVEVLGAATMISDYDPDQCLHLDDSYGSVNKASVYANIRQLAANRNSYTAFRNSICEYMFHSPLEDEDFTEDFRFYPLEEWYEDHPPTLTELLSRESLIEALDAITAGVYNCRKRVNARALILYFGMSSDEVALFVKSITDLAVKNPKNKIELSEALRPFRDKIMRRYVKGCSVPIEWWIKVDPGRQYTASRDPRIEDPVMWYGEDNVEIDPISDSSTLESFRAALKQSYSIAENTEIVYNDTCYICRNKLSRGDLNSLITSCGHIFHWNRDAKIDCGGIFTWILKKHFDCPACHTKFNIDKPIISVKEDVAVVNPPLVLKIDWPARDNSCSDEE